MSAIATSALTIFGSVIVYVVGQLVSKILIEPVHELKKSVGEVRFNLAFHAAAIRTPAARSEEWSQKAHEALLRSSCDLLARVEMIPCSCYPFLSRVFSLHPRESIKVAATKLRGLSTYVYGTQSTSGDAVDKLVTEIECRLGLEPLK
ncbi:hypothetical protein [Paraburkholderia sp. BCC1885]|uniref:hypothetical protein n=1 Tax=Paraburkholderia sp. BCC1885 TaxID=2562669 RepID=UPI00118202DC|nr:hypothetical protein [Paraburkholderia sp. BCC1885]